MRIWWVIMLAVVVGCQDKSTTTNLAEIEATIDSIKSVYAPDKRVALVDFEIAIKDGRYVIEGETNIEESLIALTTVLEKQDIDFNNKVNLLPDSSINGQVYGVINNSVGNLRSKPGHSSELATQATLGMPLNVLKKEGEWYLVQTPDDYIAWIDHGGLQLMDSSTFQSWQNANKLIYEQVYGTAYANADRKEVVSDLVMGNVLKLVDSTLTHYIVEYPDKRVGYINKVEALPFNHWQQGLTSSPQSLKEVAFRLFGAPYLWGGTSAKGMDCSGFTKTIYLMNGKIIPRDASQQVHAGKLIDETKDWDKLAVGDLLFFGRPQTDSTRERVVHVGMWVGDNKFIHASQRVRISSVDPEAQEYDEFNVNRYLRTKRYLGALEGNIIDLAQSKVF